MLEEQPIDKDFLQRFDLVVGIKRNHVCIISLSTKKIEKKDGRSIHYKPVFHHQSIGYHISNQGWNRFPFFLLRMCVFVLFQGLDQKLTTHK